jgi:hypothetical protein
MCIRWRDYERICVQDFGKRSYGRSTDVRELGFEDVDCTAGCISVLGFGTLQKWC